MELNRLLFSCSKCKKCQISRHHQKEGTYSTPPLIVENEMVCFVIEVMFGPIIHSPDDLIINWIGDMFIDPIDEPFDDPVDDDPIDEMNDDLKFTRLTKGCQ